MHVRQHRQDPAQDVPHRGNFKARLFHEISHRCFEALDGQSDHRLMQPLLRVQGNIQREAGNIQQLHVVGVASHGDTPMQFLSSKVSFWAIRTL